MNSKSGKKVRKVKKPRTPKKTTLTKSFEPLSELLPDEKDKVHSILSEFIDMEDDDTIAFKWATDQIEAVFKDVYRRVMIDQRKDKHLHQPSRYMAEACQIYQVSVHRIQSTNKDAKIIAARKWIAEHMIGDGYGYSDIGRTMNKSPSTILRGLREGWTSGESYVPRNLKYRTKTEKTND